MDNVQTVNRCTNKASSQAFRFYEKVMAYFKEVFPKWCSTEPRGSAKGKHGFHKKISLQSIFIISVSQHW
jgi:hypothetical protein